MKEQLTLESDESKRAELAALVKEKEAAVDELIDKFSHAALEAAQRVSGCKLFVICVSDE